jgi:hypothetical protein
MVIFLTKERQGTAFRVPPSKPQCRRSSGVWLWGQVLPALLRNFHRYGLIRFSSLPGPSQEFFRSHYGARTLHKSLHLVLGPNMVGRSHFLHLESFGDDTHGISCAAEGHESCRVEIGVFFGIHFSERLI